MVFSGSTLTVSRGAGKVNAITTILAGAALLLRGVGDIPDIMPFNAVSFVSRAWRGVQHCFLLHLMDASSLVILRRIHDYAPRYG